MSKTSSELYLDLRRRLPSWLFRGLSVYPEPAVPLLNDGAILGDGEMVGGPVPGAPEAIRKDIVFGSMTDSFAEGFYAWFERVIAQTRLLEAEGEWLYLHGVDRGTPRRELEADDDYRDRLRTIPEVVTERGLYEAAREVIPEGEIDVFTLRYRYLFFGRKYFGTNARWGVATVPKDDWKAGRISLAWGRGHWRRRCWASFGIWRNVWFESPWLVAVVIVPRLVRAWKAYWRGHGWDHGWWYSAGLDAGVYRALREALEERRAAGVAVWIWIASE